MRQSVDNVSASKEEARRDLSSALLPTVGASALYLLPGLLLAQIAQLLVLRAVGTQQQLPPGQLAACVGLYLLARLLIEQPLYFGLTQYCALLRAGARPRASLVTLCLGEGRLYAASLRLSLLVALFSLLWAVPIAATAGGAVYALSLVLTGRFGLYLSAGIVLTALLVYACAVARYHCAYALLAERRELGCWRAVRLAARSFRGHGHELFRLTAGFFSWFLLAMLLGTLLLLYVCPYYVLSLYHLFDRARGVRIQAEAKQTGESTE